MLEIETERLLLKCIDATHSQAVLDYLIRNKAFFAPWSPKMQDGFYTIDHQAGILEDKQRLFEEGKEIRLYLFRKDSRSGRIIGDIGLSNIIKGFFCSAFVGYKIDAAEANKGYMREALEAAIVYAFKDLGLHRIEANVMPHNAPSIRLLEKLGFEREGYSRKYLKINGNWEDHLRFAILNEKAT